METTPDDGLPVDYYIPDGYSTSKKELGDTSEPLLATALNLISGKESVVGNRTVGNKYKESNYPHVHEIGLPSFFRFYSENGPN